MKKITEFIPGIVITIILGMISEICSSFIPNDIISAGVFAMLIGMVLYPFVKKIPLSSAGINFTSKHILKASIVLMGATLSFTQVLHVGKYSLIVMVFTLTAAFLFGNLFGKLFHMNWKLSNLISAGTGICGGSAIAALSPTIEAKDSDIAYAISATFIFDIVMVVLFPIMGRFFGMSDMGFGLWSGTAINDTSSVVAAGYAFSDAAGQYATIVKLTRTLSIVPIVLIFAYVNQKIKAKEMHHDVARNKVSVQKIFPWFILLFLIMVAIRTIVDAFLSVDAFGATSITSETVSSIADTISEISKFAMIMALGAIGLKTDFKKVAKSGFLPMLHGFIISALVVIIAFFVQYLMGQM